jgi:rRNA maturation endonuclease Nob1
MAMTPNPTPSDCEWRETEDGQWDTECEECFEFNNNGPKENNFIYCPYCGFQVTSVPFDDMAGLGKEDE